MKWISVKDRSAPTETQRRNADRLLITDGYAICESYHIDRQYGDGPDKIACSIHRPKEEEPKSLNCPLRYSRNVTHWLLIKLPKTSE